ncbi:MAG TPA: septum formation initiator family protein [Solirubrobacteraceae bacterium]|jgi:cell division protein FtsB|nr:septum formation initiator family protein [Solirubrobacteraceae bacterium]
MARVRWDRVGRIGLLVVLAVVGGLYVTHILSFLQTKAQDDSQLATVRTLIRSNDKLERQQRALSQPATIAADARRLGMVKVGEHPYVITGGN